MKKLMTMMMAAAVVFAVAGRVQAAALETSGEYRARYWYLDNYVADEQTTEYWDQRLRLNMVWPIAEGVKLQARADIMEGYWGDSLLEASATTPGSFTAVRNNRSQIDFDQVNLTFPVGFLPGAVVQVGRQEANWGPGIFVKADNRDRFKLTYKFGDFTALYTYDKYIDVVGFHDTNSLDDRRQHSLGVIGKAADVSFGLIYGMILNNTDPNVDSTLNAIDVYAMGKAAMVDYKAEVAYAFGKNDLTTGTDVDLSGLIAYLGLSMPAGPVTVGLEGAYAQGDKPGTADKSEGSLKFDYQSPFWSIILFNNFDYNGFRNESQAGATDTSVGNAIAAKLSVAAAPAKGLNVAGAVVYATRDKVAAGAEKDMGIELDLVCSYAIAENVTWTLGVGYLMAGDAYGDVSDPLGAMTGFTVKF